MFYFGSLFCKLLLHGQVAAGVVQMHLGLHLVWKLLLQVTAAGVVQRQPTQSANATQPTMHLGAITFAAQCSPILGFSSTQFETEDFSKGAKATQPSMHLGATTLAAHLYLSSAQSSITLSIVVSIVFWLSAILKTEADMT